MKALLSVLLLVASSVGAQGTRPETVTVAPAVRIDVPLADFPYNARFGARAPSMQQALSVTAGVYDAGHFAIQQMWGTHTKLAKTTIAVVDLLTIEFPLTDAWLHEDWHRTVLGNRGIDSHDDVDDKLNVLTASISVSNVSDEDLAAMKRQHPTDFVRLKEAGIEGEYSLITQMEQEKFYRGGRAWNTALYWLIAINSVGYVADTSGADAMTDDANAKERTVAVRDISGHDFTAWVRDLFRPNEPFEARGIHPSGVGINRYTKTTDLTLEERGYLHHEGRLAFLNFADPNLLGITGFTVWNRNGPDPVHMNLALRHLLTSFGHTVDANVFLKQGTTNLFVALHAYANDARTLPGLDAQIIDRPVTIAGRQIELSPRLALWMQPADQAFRTHDAQAGALAGLRASTVVSGRLGAFAEAEVKTAGWVAGVVQLDRAINVRVGASTTLW
jgi:hypothetical protein